MCSYASPESLMPPVELLSSAAVAREWNGCEVKLIDAIAEKMDNKSVEKSIAAYAPDVILSITSFEYFDVDVDVFKHLKFLFPHISFIYFGYYATQFPEETIKLSGADYVILGEPEKQLHLLLKALKEKTPVSNIQGIAFKNETGGVSTNSYFERLKDPNELPVPAYDLISNGSAYHEPLIPRPYGMIQTIRGCPYQCNYCVKSYGSKLSQLTTARIIEEVRIWKQMFNVKAIRFIDDTFTINKRRVIELCKALIEEQLEISWVCLSRTDNLDEELLQWMKKSGCIRIYFGMESGSQRMLDIYKKGVKVNEAKDAFLLCRKVGIETAAFFMGGHPLETSEDVKETTRFAVQSKIDFVSFNPLTPYPGTSLYSEYKDLIDFSLYPQKHAWKDNPAMQSFQKNKNYFYKKFYLNSIFLIRQSLNGKNYHFRFKRIRGSMNFISWIRISLCIFLLTVVLVFVFTGYYTSPNAEDFSLAGMAKNYGILNAALNLLAQYDGRYFTNLLHGLNPLAFGWISGYKFMPLIGIALFILSLFFVLHEIFEDAKPVLFVTLVIAVLYLSLNTSIVHLLYWMVSSFVYLWPWIFVFAVVGCYLRYQKNNSEWWYTGTMLFSILGIGMNEMFLPIYLLFVVFLFAHDKIKNRLVFSNSLALILVITLCIIFFIFSPGIHVRVKNLGQAAAKFSTLQSLLIGIRHFIYFFFNTLFNPVLISSGFVLMLCTQGSKFHLQMQKISAQVKTKIILFIMLITVAMNVPYYLFMCSSESLPERVFSASMLPMLIACLYLVYSVSIVSLKFLSSIISKVAIGALSFFVFVGCLFTTENNFSGILSEYNSGLLINFNAASAQRLEEFKAKVLINNCYSKSTVSAIAAYPKYISLKVDIEPNRSLSHWNMAYEEYFQVDMVEMPGDTLHKYDSCKK
jgi:radical SAM superfamily enzyme YgiQ (UPF0313 family)